MYTYIYIYIYICSIMYLGKFDHDLTVLPHWILFFFLRNHPIFMAVIQVREILEFTQMCRCIM